MAPESTLSDWLTANPPPDERFTQTLAGVAERVIDGEDLRFAVREFLDESAIRGSDELRAATGGLSRPAWAIEPSRFLDAFWFPSPVPGFRAIAIAQSPAAFRRRGIFIARGSLERR